MDWLWHDGKFLGIEWGLWKLIGWSGNLVFFSRFFVQWYATEKQGRVVVPPLFWWLSLVGSGLLLAYALFYRRDSVFIFAYAFTWIPYIRNLIIHRRSERCQPRCSHCGATWSGSANYCPACGVAMEGGALPEPEAA